jgi:hypothetical protein
MDNPTFYRRTIAASLVAVAAVPLPWTPYGVALLIACSVLLFGVAMFLAALYVAGVTL